MTGSLSYRSQSIDLLCKSVDWFLYDNGPRHEIINNIKSFSSLEHGPKSDKIISTL